MLGVTSSPDRPQTPGRSGLVLGLSLILGWLLLLAPLPYSLLSGAVGLVVAVAAVLAARARWRRGGRASAIATAVVALGAALVLVGSSALSAVFYPQMRAYEECRASVLTHRAEQRCADEVQQGISARIAELMGA